MSLVTRNRIPLRIQIRRKNKRPQTRMTFRGNDQFGSMTLENGIFPAPISVFISISFSTVFPI